MSTTKSYDYTPTVVSKTNRSFEPGLWGLPYDYIAIGFQQWGNAGNSGGSVNVTFPVSFTKTVYQIQLTYNNESYENPTYEIKDTKSFRYWSKYGGNKLWLAIGAQQWGHKDNSTSIVTFNLSFPTTCFIALVETLNDGTVNSHLRLSGATNVGFSTWDSATNRPYSVQNYWLALGI